MSRRGSTTRLRSSSESGISTPKSRITDVTNTVRRSRSRAKIIEDKRIKPNEKMVGISTIAQSTPINSPPSLIENLESNNQGAISKINDEFASNYLTTPLAESAGTALISTPAALPVISSSSSIVEVNNYLDALVIHIEDFENNLVSNPDWKTSRHTRYTFLTDCISNARYVGMKNKYLTVSLKCSELSAKIDDIKMNLSLKCRNDNLNSFHGFSTIAETSNSNAETMNNPVASKPIEPEPVSKTVEERLNNLETCVSSFNSLKAQFPQLGERVAVLEDSNQIDIGARIMELEQLCNSLNNSEELIQLRNRVTNTEVRIEINEDSSTKHDWQLNQLIKIKDSMENELSSFKKATALDMEDLRNSIQSMNQAAPTFYCQNERSIQNESIPNTVIPTNTNKNTNQRAVSATAALSIPVNKNENISKWLASSSIHQSSTQSIQRDKISGNPDNEQSLLQKTTSYQKSDNQHLSDQFQASDHCQAPNPQASDHQVSNCPIPNQHTIPKRTLSENDDAASTSSINSSRISAMNVQGRILKSNMKGLKKLLNPKSLEGISKCTLTDIYKNRLITADIQCRELKKDLKDYFKVPNHDMQLCEAISDTIEDCINWCAEVREMYHNQGIHKKSQATKLYDTLTQFTKHSEVDVYDFFRRFSAYTEEFDIPEEKAELLFNKFLAVDIQDEVAEYKDDFNSMKKVLFHRYGDLKTITSDILLPVSKCSKPNAHTLDSSMHLDYYRRFNSAMQKINKLLKSSDVPVEEAKEYIYSQDFMHLLLSYVPSDAKIDFTKKMQDLDEDTVRIKGKTSFKVLLGIILQRFQIHDTNARTDNPPAATAAKYKKEKAKRVNNIHSAHKSISSDSEGEQEHVTSSTLQSNFKGPVKSLPVNKLKFPCLIENHDHEISQCREFFFKDPKERLELRKKAKFKYCLVCLQSSEACYSKKCENVKSVPTELICKDCKTAGKITKKPWYSILFCFSEKHNKPENSKILKAFEEYIPEFKSSMLNAPINLAAHFQILAGTKSSMSNKSNSGDPNPLQPAPAFNTSTGKHGNPLPVDIIPEIHHDSIGVMQYLNLNGKNVLCLFDRGANQHLVEGQLAEELEFKVHRKEPCAIGVVSGSTVVTEYGSYQMLLGPTSSGKYHELVAQGITSITSKVAKYDLFAVNSEARESTDLPTDTQFPAYVGDNKIGLLIGLKSPELEPTCIFTLPSGIGLYKSPFKDIFGSYYCYGGPHESFTNTNKQFHGSANHFNVYFTQVVNQYRNSLYPSLLEVLKPKPIESEYNITNYAEPNLPYSYVSTCGQKVYPTPLTANDFTELGQSVIDEKDDDICSNQHCLCLNATIFRAKIPLSKQRSYIDEADVDDTINFRCDQCKLCKCSLSNRGKLMSLNEKIEQEIIEESVTINLEEKRVYVDLPFVKPVDDILLKKHKGSDILHQAKRVYKSQCKYSDEKKEKMRTAFYDLVNKGFMKKLSDLPQEHQDLIKDAKFRHYMPWRVIEREESQSTPFRYVVDPSMTGLNQALAKGQNKMRRIQDMIIRARTKKYMWTSDISKLYNRLYLKPSSYRYQLFLFGDELDPDKEPEVYAMIRAWYGVASSSNQSSFALEELARLLKVDFPLAFIILTEDTYVDDMIGGADTVEECNEQISQVLNVLEAGGFSTKFVITSGQSNIDESIKVLGYKWAIKNDNLAPGFNEVNFNPKKRGHRDANPFPVHAPEDISKLLDSKSISRRMVVSKIAEFWDPCGLWEPYKIQLKLGAQMLNGIDWDLALSDEMQSHWTNRFKEFLMIPDLNVKRCIIPEGAISNDIRLICVSDAAEYAGGGAIYAGVKLNDGSFSCKLIASKSRLMSGSIPRNELEAIRLTAGLALDVKTALGENVKDVLFFTDSSIALSWCHNTSKRLRLYCLNRVMEIRRLIKSIIGSTDSFPLYHIDGKSNPADYLTKQSSIKPCDLTEDSIWVNGFPWMSLEFNSMPITTYSDIQLTATQNQLLTEECFPEIKLPSAQINHLDITGSSLKYPHCSGCLTSNGFITIQHCFGSSIENPHCVECNCKSSFYSLALKVGKTVAPHIDIVHHGYQRSLNIMSNVLDFSWFFKHNLHCKKGIMQSPDCKKCNAISACNGVKTEYSKILKAEALQYFLRIESKRLESVLPKNQLEKFTLKDGIYYASSRIPQDAQVVQEDLDFEVFFDGADIKSNLPVVSADSPLFYALLMYIHHSVRKHAGNEPTLKAIMNTVYPINNPRRIIQAVRKHCPKCCIIIRKTLELEIGQHPQARYHIVPAFYNSMCDIVYGFNARPFKESKTRIKIYALVIVCLLTSATSILAIEGLETQDVVMAIERHSSRYGVPSCLFVDQGTQLISLEKVKMNIRDAHLQLKESLGINIIGSTAKSHCERGRAERKIRTLRDMLKKCSINTDFSMTAMQWETTFSKMSSEIDDIPIARADGSSTADFGWDILTPNRFKLGRSNHRAIEGPMYLSESSSPALLLKRIKSIQSYWYQLLIDRIHHLIPQNSKWDRSDNFEIQDIVVFRFKDSSSSKLEVWKVGKIVEIIKGGRGVLISFPTVVPGSDKVKVRFVERCPRDVSIISSYSDLNLNSTEFFNKIQRL